MADVSFLGSKITVIAVPTFPQGIPIEEFPDDADPINFENIDLTKYAVGVNGDLISWDVANVIPCEINVIPNSEADKNLDILATACRPAKNKVAIKNDITLVVAEVNGKITTYTGGKIVNVPTGNSASSDSRIKTKTYTFVFQNKI